MPLLRRVAVLALVAGLLAGCTVGRPSGFTARSNDTCRQARAVIGKLDAPSDPAAGLAYAMDRYVAVEKAVATLTEDPQPGGSAGRAVRTRWLDPARTSLRAGRTQLGHLRDAVRAHDAAAATSAFATAATAGTGGVDVGLLQARGLTACAALFAPDVPVTSWVARD